MKTLPRDFPRTEDDEVTAMVLLQQARESQFGYRVTDGATAVEDEYFGWSFDTDPDATTLLRLLIDTGHLAEGGLITAKEWGCPDEYGVRLVTATASGTALMHDLHAGRLPVGGPNANSKD